MAEPTRASLLSRIRDPADERSWREFSDQYGELILRYCRRRGLQHTDAEDVRQIVLLSLAQAFQRSGADGKGFRYSPERGRFRDYLGATVRHAIQRYLSRHGRAAAGLPMDVEDAAETAPAQDPLWEREWTDHHFRIAMATLSGGFEPRSLEVFRRLMAGAEARLVAEEFAVSAEAVRKIKQRILDRLKDLVAEQVRQEDEPDG
jgi:RNA polymerase sigma factor (sigma-70 family)